MSKRATCITIMAMLAVSITAAGTPAVTDSVGDERGVGLVLSGGGARGIAEIAAIKVLEDNDIPIDYITGTSIGAIVGGLYASGYSPDEMMEVIKSKMFIDASQGQMDPSAAYLFFTPEQRPTMLSLSFDRHTRKMAPILPTSIISPMPMNFMAMSIFSPGTAQCRGNFDDLFVPLRTVASDMTHKRAKIWSHGRLSDAVRSSMSFPLVFKPVTVDGCYLYDGGIFDNFPVGLMRHDFDPSVMIGIDIHSSDTVSGFPDLLQQLDMLVMRHNSYELPDSDGVKLRIDLNQFSLLDFAKADEIYEIGREHTQSMVDSIKERITARRPAEEVAQRRREWRDHTPRVIFDSVTVSGASPAQNAYLAYQFQPTPGKQFDVNSALDSYSRVLSTRQLYDLDPMAVYNDSTGHFDLHLQADVKPDLYLNLGGYISSSANSMLYLSAGYRSLSFRSMDASVGAWIGQSYMAAEINTRMMLRRRQASAFGIQAVVWRQKFHESDKLFYQDDAPAFITDLEAYVRPVYSIATGLRSRLDIGVAFGHIEDKFYNNDGFSGNRDDSNSVRHNLGQLMLRWQYTTLDNSSAPLSGTSIGIMAQGIDGHFNHVEGSTHGIISHNLLDGELVGHEQSGSEHWLQIEAQLRKYFALGSRWSMGIESTVLASTRPLLNCYNAAIVNAPAFNPTPSSYNVFNADLRANQFVTAGIVPIYRLSDRASIRGAVHAFMPMREIESSADGSAHYSRHWFPSVRCFCELSGTLRLPFADLTVYGSWQTAPTEHWGVGISLGYYILAPRLTRL